MPNRLIFQRLQGVQQTLMGVHRSGAPMSAASKGAERQVFIEGFLGNVLPSLYRFGTGDATDVHGHRSGQLDVVVEYPFSPSLPSVGGTTRLYLAESVAAVVEVKSDLSAQWGEAVRTADLLAPLQRTFGAMSFVGSPPSDRIPLFVAGYTGWAKQETVAKYLAENPHVAGILVIENGIFAASDAFGGMTASGPWGLWALICCLHQVTNALQAASTDPIGYAM
jgi:hypothetical protein